MIASRFYRNRKKLQDNFDEIWKITEEFWETAKYFSKIVYRLGKLIKFPKKIRKV